MNDEAASPIAVVTGAAGEMGQRIGAQLASDGYKVVGLDRVEVSDSHRAFDSYRVADQTSRAAVEAALSGVVDEFGRLDAVVANAGYAKFSPWIDMDPRVFERHVAVNLVGTFNVMQVSAQRMASLGVGGSIVVIASSLAGVHADQVGAYSVTKGALVQLATSMAAELGVHGIRVNSVSPGVVETSMTDGMLAGPGVREDLEDRTPLRRLGSGDDVARAVAFLCSDAASWITGASLAVDGGQSIYGEPRWIRQTRQAHNTPGWVSGLGSAT